MAAGFPDLRRHDDGRFEAGDVVALAGHGVPPEFLDVALEFRAERAVIPKTVDAAVDFRGLEDESLAFAQGHDFFHQFIAFRVGHKGRIFQEAQSGVKARLLELSRKFTRRTRRKQPKPTG